MASKFTDPNTIKFWGPSNTDMDAGGFAATLSATGYSPMIRLPRKGGIQGVHLIWSATGAPDGTFSVQYSLVPSPDEATEVDWAPDASATFIGTGAATGAAAGSSIVVAGNIPMGGWMRIKWTRTSGTLSVRGYCTMPSA